MSTAMEALTVGRVATASKAMSDTGVCLGAALLVLSSPGLADAYVDPTGGGFLLQLLLGGGTAFVLLARIFFRRLVDRLGRRSRRPK